MNVANNYSPNNAKIIWANNNHGIMSQKDGNIYDNSVYLTNNDMFKLVDCVFENSNKNQFVVPFVILDPKAIHLLPNFYGIKDTITTDFKFSKGGMYSNFTDNRYGQVIEKINDDVKDEFYIYHEVYDVKNKKWSIISNEEYKELNREIYIDDGHSIIYFNKDLNREIVSACPIEPLVEHNMTTLDICEVLFKERSNDYRLICMRLYNDSCKLANGYWEMGEDGKYRINVDIYSNNLWDKEKEKIDNNTNAIEKEIKKNGFNEIYDYYNAGKVNNIIEYGKVDN